MPVLLVACAAISFAIVMLLMNRHDGGSNATSTPAKTVTQQPAAASAPSSDSAGPASSGVGTSSALSSTPASATSAAFSVDAVTTCGGGSHHTDEKLESLDETVRVRAKSNGTPSCEFVRKIQGDVASQLTKNSAAETFTFQETSVRQDRAPYPVTCARSHHRTTCAVNNSAPFDYVIYVRDSVG